MIEAKGTNGTIRFDGRAVTIDRKGLVARSTVGKGTKTIPVGSIVAVQWKSAGLVAGFIQFTISGGAERRSKFGRQSTDAMKDENSVAFHVHKQGAFERVRDAVQAAIAETYEPAPAAQQPAAPVPQGPPPGWYKDPREQATSRWWDGTAWTEHTQE